MRPRPFVPEIVNADERFVRDKNSNMVWHRVMHRSLYADTDRSAVVYHANYLRYFELGRASLMRDTGFSYRSIEESGYIYPIIELGITFHQPLYYDDPMWVHTRPAQLERVKITIEYVITTIDTYAIVCKGFTTHCALNSKKMPTAIDPHTRAMWEAFPS